MPVVRTAQAADHGDDRRETGRLLRLMKLLQSMCDDERFNAEDIGLMVALSRYTPCFPSQSLLGEQLQKSRPWVNAHLVKLVEGGILLKTRRNYAGNGEKSCLYEIVFDLAAMSENVAKAKKGGASVTTLRSPSMRQCSEMDVAVPRGAREDASSCLPADTVRQDHDTACQARDTNLFNSKPSEHERKERRGPALSPSLSSQPVHPARRYEDDGVKGGVGEAVVDLEMAALAKRIQRSSPKPWKLATASKVVEAAVARVGIDVVRQVAEDDLIGAGLPPWEMAARLEALCPRKARTSGPESLLPVHTTVTAAGRATASPCGGDEHGSREAKQALASLSRTEKTAADFEVERLAVRLLNQADAMTRNVIWFKRAKAAGCPSDRCFDVASWAPWIAYQFLEENDHRTLARIISAGGHPR